jgi:diaminopimelate decarboxylase
MTEPPARAGPWPRRASFDERGLVLGGLAATALASRFGTPLLVMDELEVRDRCRRVRAAFPQALYAVKAFTAHAVIRIALEEGFDLLAATGGEVEACLRAGAPPARVVLHGNAKTDSELELAIGAGLGLVIADGHDELSRLDAIARRHGRAQRILLRVVPEVEVDTHEAIATGHDASKFGTPLATAPEVIRSAAGMSGIAVEGIHAHIGSQLLQAEPYLRTLEALLDLSARVRHDAGIVVRTIDLGGGFGVRYVDEHGLDVDADGLDVDALAHAMRRRLADATARLGIEPPSLVVEPGRWLVANAGVTLYRVVASKTVAGGRRLLAVDGGMSDNVRPALYDAAYTVAVASPPGASGRGVTAASGGGLDRTFTVVGRHCESGDTLAEDVCLPASTVPGDLLAFAATGAYTYSLASTYNRVGRPAVVSVREGVATPWLRREDAADLDRLEIPGARSEVLVKPVEGITIRPAKPADARSYLEFWTAIVEEGRHVRTERVTSSVRDHRRRFRRAWTEREAQIVAIADGGRVVGHVYAQREAHPVTRHVATLGIAVAADARGRGVGTALMAEAIRWARSVRVDKITLSVYPHNVGAIALYHRFGFVEEGRLARHSRKSYGDEDEILMSAWIDAGDDGVDAEAGDEA